jgi:hypothetical protein
MLAPARTITAIVYFTAASIYSVLIYTQHTFHKSMRYCFAHVLMYLIAEYTKGEQHISCIIHAFKKYLHLSAGRIKATWTTHERYLTSSYYGNQSNGSTVSQKYMVDFGKGHIVGTTV